MIKELKAYSLYCDGCREQFDGCDFTIWADAGDALDAASCSDWIERDGKHYCYDCSIPFRVDDDKRDNPEGYR